MYPRGEDGKTPVSPTAIFANFLTAMCVLCYIGLRCSIASRAAVRKEGRSRVCAKAVRSISGDSRVVLSSPLLRYAELGTTK